MDALIATLASSGNLAVIVLVMANGGLLWLVRYLLSAAKDNAAAWAQAERENAASDVRLAEALTLLRVEIANIARPRGGR